MTEGEAGRGPGALARRVVPKAAWFRRHMTPAQPHQRQLPWALLALAVAGLVIVGGFALDAASVPWARGLPDGLRQFAQFMSDVGQSQWYLVPSGVLLILLALGDWTREEQAVRAGWIVIAAFAAFLFLSVGLGGIVTNILKIIIGRGRPILFDEGGWLTVDPLTVGYAYASFPSGHATTAGSLIVVGGLVFARLRLLFLAFGLAIVLSRIVVGAHYPSDLVAGLAVGGTVAYLVARFLAARRIGFHAGPHGRLIADWATVGSGWRSGAPAFLTAPLRALRG